MSDKRGRNFYAELEIPRTANQGEIKHAYRKLAIRYHPDKNPGNAESAEKFKSVCNAYAVLSDPNKKRQYDLYGEDGNMVESGSVRVDEMGTVGRLFGAIITKAGIPVPTEIAQKVTTTAKHIQSGATTVPGFVVPQVHNLDFGEIVAGTVERQHAHFYRLNVSEQDLSHGIIISCASAGSDKFKLVFFDFEGAVSMVEESQKKKRRSESNIFIVPFGRYSLNEQMPFSMLKQLEEDVPPVFMILDTFQKDIKSLRPGSHLFCVYGDNWFQSVKYTVRCLVASDPSSEIVERLKLTEVLLEEKKQHLATFQTEFCDIKKKYVEACNKLKGDIQDTQTLIDQRETAYRDYIDESASKYLTTASLRPPQFVARGGKGRLIGNILG